MIHKKGLRSWNAGLLLCRLIALSMAMIDSNSRIQLVWIGLFVPLFLSRPFPASHAVDFRSHLNLP
jgi:hypothetical protein